jgi:hypothetical protein
MPKSRAANREASAKLTQQAFKPLACYIGDCWRNKNMSSTVFDQPVEAIIRSIDQLREIAKSPSRYVDSKVIDHVDPLARRFIAASPLAILGTRRADGGVDQTPRGDPPGFVKVLDPKTIALPDRPGNNRMDAIENILTDSAVGLLFLIPGHGDRLELITVLGSRPMSSGS